MRLQCSKCNVVNELNPEDAGQAICGNCGQVLEVPERTIAPWVVFHDFVIRRILRRGSDGVEVIAHQISLDRPVVLKILSRELSENPDYVNLFVKRARAASKLNHPNIVPVYLVAREYGLYFLAREMTELQNLRDILSRERQIDVASALPVFQQIAEALDYSWTTSRLLHNNLKPAYITISEYGIAKLSDLGVAQLDLGDEPDKIKGTPQYISPEMILGERADIRSDIYSLGAVFYQCLTGHYAYEADSTVEMFEQHLQAPFRPPGELDSDISDDLSLLIEKMMAKSPDDRYPDCSTLSQDLLRLMQGGRPDFALGSPPPSAQVLADESEPEEEMPVARVAQPSPIGLVATDDHEEDDDEEIAEAQPLDDDVEDEDDDDEVAEAQPVEDDDEEEEPDVEKTLIANRPKLKKLSSGSKGPSSKPKRLIKKPSGSRKKLKTKVRLPKKDK